MSSLVASDSPISSNSGGIKNKLLKFLKKFKIVIMLIILTIIIIVIIIYSSKKKVKVYNQYFHEYISSKSPEEIPNCDIKIPKYGSNCTVSCWINIQNFYENHRFWKHIFHKGTEINSKDLIKYEEWENLTKDISQQYCGLWLHPNKNSFRICFTTENINKYDSTEHPNPNTFPTGYKVRPNNILEYIVEYFDIDNIPINILTHILWTIDDRVIKFYINGILESTFITQGKILLNNGHLFFNYPLSYEGLIQKFRFIPHKIPDNTITNLYNE